MGQPAEKLEPELPQWIEDAIAALPALVTTDEAASALRMSKRTLARNLADGRIKSVRHGEGGAARRLIPRGALAAYLRSLEA
jgi:excisionase family DNA binding protein